MRYDDGSVRECALDRLRLADFSGSVPWRQVRALLDPAQGGQHCWFSGWQPCYNGALPTPDRGRPLHALAAAWYEGEDSFS